MNNSEIALDCVAWHGGCILIRTKNAIDKYKKGEGTMSIKERFEKVMMAATFAEAGEHDTALEIMPSQIIPVPVSFANIPNSLWNPS